MSNSIKILSFGLFISLLLNSYMFYKYTMPSKEEILANNICNAKSITYLFAIEHDKSELLNNMLQNDVVQLVHDYDENIFLDNKILSSVCQDWTSTIKTNIQIYLKKNSRKNDFYSKVFKNSKLLDSRCGIKNAPKTHTGR